MTEKIGGVEGTKLDVDFVDMERVRAYYKLSREIHIFPNLRCNFQNSNCFLSSLMFIENGRYL